MSGLQEHLCVREAFSTSLFFIQCAVVDGGKVCLENIDWSCRSLWTLLRLMYYLYGLKGLVLAVSCLGISLCSQCLSQCSCIKKAGSGYLLTCRWENNLHSVSENTVEVFLNLRTAFANRICGKLINAWTNIIKYEVLVWPKQKGVNWKKKACGFT